MRSLLASLVLIVAFANSGHAQTIQIVQPNESEQKYVEGRLKDSDYQKYWTLFQSEVKKKNIQGIKYLSHFPVITMVMLDEPGRLIPENDKVFSFGKDKLFNDNIVNSIVKTKSLKKMSPKNYNFDNYKLNKNAQLYYFEFKDRHTFGQFFFKEINGKVKLFAIHEYEK